MSFSSRPEPVNQEAFFLGRLRDLVPGGPTEDQGTTQDNSLPFQQKALVVGIAAYPDDALQNARRDAETIARVLRRDFAFEIVDGGPMLDGAATLKNIEQGLDELLQEVGPDDSCLFYFAGHGALHDDQGYLMSVYAAADGITNGYLAVADLTRRFLETPARSLIILDACFSGQALRTPDDLRHLVQSPDSNLGGVDLLTSGGPWQRVPDGQAGGHSPFTHCLLDFLEGRHGEYEPDGQILISRLADKLKPAVVSHLASLPKPLAKEPSPHSETASQPIDIVVETLRRSDLGADGRLAFRPRFPRLDPETIRDLRHAFTVNDPRKRRRGIQQLMVQMKLYRDSPRKLAWHLPLAFDVLLEGLCSRDQRFQRDQRRDSEHRPLMHGETRESEHEDARAATSRALEKLLKYAGLLAHLPPEDVFLDVHDPKRLQSDIRDARKALFQLAWRDPDPSVRHAAGIALARSIEETYRRILLRQIQRLYRKCEARGRARLRALEAQLVLTWPNLLRRGMSWSLEMARQIRRRRYPRRIAIGTGSLLAGLYLLIFLTYHIDTTPDGRLVLRTGPPGFEAVWGAGEDVFQTAWFENSLEGRRLPRNPVPWGFWFAPGGWEEHLASMLAPRHAVSSLFRFGHRAKGWERIHRWAAQGDDEALDWAVYMSLFESNSAERVAQVADTLGSRQNMALSERAMETLRRWCAVMSREKPIDSWPEVLTVPCAQGLGIANLDDVTPPPPPMDLVPLLQQALSEAETTRSDALRALVIQIEIGSPETVETASIDQLLATSLADSVPWNRAAAADGILILGQADEEVYARAFQVAVEALDRDRTGTEGQRLANRLRRCRPDARLRLIRHIANHIAATQKDLAKDFVYGLALEVLAQQSMEQAPERLADLVASLVPMFAHETLDGVAIWQWHSRLQQYLNEAAHHQPELGKRFVDELSLYLASEDPLKQRVGASLVGAVASHARDPEKVWDSLESCLVHTGTHPDPGLLMGATLSLGELSQKHPTWQPRLVDVLTRAMISPEVPRHVRPWMARFVKSSTGHPIPGPTQKLLQLAADPDHGVRGPLTEALVAWAAADSQAWTSIRPWTHQRLTVEENTEIRTALWVLHGLLSEPDTVEDAASALLAMHEEGSPMALIRAALLAAQRPEVAPQVMAALDTSWQTATTPDAHTVTFAFQLLTQDDVELASAVLSGSFSKMLHIPHASGHGSMAVIGQLALLGKTHPTLAPQAIEHLEDFIDAYESQELTFTIPKERQPGLASVIRQAWLDLAWQELETDKSWDTKLTRRLRDSSGWRRSLALDQMARMAGESPEKRSKLQSSLRHLTFSWRSEVRATATEGLEILALLELQARLDLEGQHQLSELVDVLHPWIDRKRLES